MEEDNRTSYLPTFLHEAVHTSREFLGDRCRNGYSGGWCVMSAMGQAEKEAAEAIAMVKGPPYCSTFIGAFITSMKVLVVYISIILIKRVLENAP